MTKSMPKTPVSKTKKASVENSFCHAYNSYKYDTNIDNNSIKIVPYMWR